jgi:hypothetical protein
MTTTSFNALIDKMMGHTSNARVTTIKATLKTAFSDVRTQVAAGLADKPVRAKVLNDFGNHLAEEAATLASNLRGAS